MTVDERMVELEERAAAMLKLEDSNSYSCIARPLPPLHLYTDAKPGRKQSGYARIGSSDDGEDSSGGENESTDNSGEGMESSNDNCSSENVAALQNSAIPLNTFKNTLIKSLVRDIGVTSKTPGSNGFAAVSI